MTQQLTINLAPSVVERFPDFRAEFLLVENRPYEDPEQASVGAARVLTRTQEAHGDVASLDGCAADECYRSFYRSMGLKAAQVSNPVKQARRVLASGAYRTISRAVDLAMEIEYATLVSFQLYGADSVGEKLTYRLARGDEPITTTRGETKLCKPGELTLMAAERAVHSSYYGNEAAYMLREDSSLALVRIMGVPGLAEEFDAACLEAHDRFRVLEHARVADGRPAGHLLADSPVSL